MFDKQAQRMRAVNQAQALLKQGVQAPVLPPIPTPKPAPVQPQGKTWAVPPRAKSPVTVLDFRQREIAVGDQVVYSRYTGAALLTGKVVGFSKSRKSVRILGPKALGRSTVEFYKPVKAVAKVD